MSEIRHVLESQQFDREKLEFLFKRTDFFVSRFFQGAASRACLRTTFSGELLFNVFYEASTRTRFSFASAATHLGMTVVDTENARDFSSAAKGETLEDTIRVLSRYYPSVIVLRHYEEGSSKKAAEFSSVPIINAGDGKGQHPTQALLDVYTIEKHRKIIDGSVVLIGGDLKNGRTARSLAYLLAKFNFIRIIFVSPQELKIEDDIKDYLERHSVEFEESEDLRYALAESDVVYWTRIQKERMSDEAFRKNSCLFSIGNDELRCMSKNAILMHPLPRVDEIKTEVDSDPRAVYFDQAQNGMFIRMALLEWVLGV